jgi:hypothetical protein
MRDVIVTCSGERGARATAPGGSDHEWLRRALPDLETGEWNDPTLLEQLVKSSATVTLRDGEATRQNCRIGGG